MLGNVLHSPSHSGGRPDGRPFKRSRKRSSVLTKYAQQSLAGFLAFVVAAAVLAQIIPSPTIPSNIVFVGPKNDYYQAHKDEYSALFFGSSRVYNQILPDAFDDATRQIIGQTPASSGSITSGSINSYNFGVPAMRAIDSAVLLEDVLANPPKNLKWVFFESILDKGYEPIPNARTYRAIYWHNWENTAIAAQYIFNSDESLPKKLVLFGSHLLPFLYHHINVGRLFNQVLPSEFSEEERTVAAEFTAQEGFYPLREQSDPKRQAFLQDPAGYEDAVATLTAAQAQFETAVETEDAYLSTNKQLLLERITQTIRAAGAEPIFIEPPSLHPENDFQAAQKLGIIDNLLSYKDPQRFPQLYAPQNRHDADHLNETGSREFTALLARDFAQGFASNTDLETAPSDSEANR
ncbi:MAG: hypothetical protein AAFV90_01420 [Cyanobacteria bacterium J06634_5]